MGRLGRQHAVRTVILLVGDGRRSRQRARMGRSPSGAVGPTFGGAILDWPQVDAASRAGDPLAYAGSAARRGGPRRWHIALGISARVEPASRMDARSMRSVPRAYDSVELPAGRAAGWPRAIQSVAHGRATLCPRATGRAWSTRSRGRPSWPSPRSRAALRGPPTSPGCRPSRALGARRTLGPPSRRSARDHRDCYWAIAEASP